MKVDRMYDKITFREEGCRHEVNRVVVVPL
jgi:hypothetical protein